MGENSTIQWCHHTMNPWIGCTKVSPACDNCYAEAWDKRYEGGSHWGPKAERRRTSEANWRQPIKWNKQAEESGQRLRVFCASLADVFDNAVPDEWRADLWDLIAATPHLDWLLLTKRPQNIAKMLPPIVRVPGVLGLPVPAWGNGWPNVWLGTTAENQTEAERRVPHLLNVPAVVRFLSCEPLLGEIRLNDLVQRVGDGGDFSINALTGDLFDSVNGIIDGAYEGPAPRINWVIAGGESGPNHRPCPTHCYRTIRDDCKEAGVPFLFKQYHGKNTSDIKLKGRLLDGVLHDEYPRIFTGKVTLT